jgi:hypothetical protein
MGILDMLRPHLEAVTKAFRDNEVAWLSMLEDCKTGEIEMQQEVELDRIERNQAAESFREQGNAFFKAHKFIKALRMYSQSIAAALEGPLASQAYFNRFSFLICLSEIFTHFNDVLQICSTVSNEELQRLHQGH